jgi:SAM-dependent methyltransferase
MPNVARMYDYLLGGVNNFAADRVAVDRVLTHMPQQRASAVDNRMFLDRVVRFIAAPEQGVTQFLDVGAGLPMKQSVHETARWVNPGSRVAYVDYDPVVVSHGKAMLAERECSVFVQADLRDPEAILGDPDIRAHLDFGQPVALLLVNVLHWISDVDDPYRVLSVLRDAIAPGSYLVLTHGSRDLVSAASADAAKRAARVFDRASAQPHPRGRAEIMRFFEGWSLEEPGLVPRHEWRPAPGAAGPPGLGLCWAGVARKP